MLANISQLVSRRSWNRKKAVGCIGLMTLVTLLYSCSSSPKEYFGKFSGTVKAEWLDDGREMKLLGNFSFEDPNGVIWSADAGDVVDGASIPAFLWALVGAPYSGKYREASVVHDVACQERARTWESVHLAFYYAMRTSGVSETKAKVMYAGVYHGGPRWPIVKTRQVLVEEAGEKTIEVPAIYETRRAQVMIEPKKTTRKRVQHVRPVEIVVRSEVDAQGREWAHVEVPARYRTETQEVLVQPATTKRVAVPATYRAVSETIEPVQKMLNNEEILAYVRSIESGGDRDTSASLEDIRSFGR